MTGAFPVRSPKTWQHFAVSSPKQQRSVAMCRKFVSLATGEYSLWNSFLHNSKLMVTLGSNLDEGSERQIFDLVIRTKGWDFPSLLLLSGGQTEGTNGLFATPTDFRQILSCQVHDFMLLVMFSLQFELWFALLVILLFLTFWAWIVTVVCTLGEQESLGHVTSGILDYIVQLFSFKCFKVSWSSGLHGLNL